MKAYPHAGGWLLRIDRGERIIERLKAFAEEQDLEGGTFTGIGGIRETTLGYYDLDQKRYLKREFPGPHELLSLIGNISLSDNRSVVHAHATIGGPDLQISGGHLVEAEVALTAEIAIAPGPPLHRKPDQTSGLNLLS